MLRRADEQASPACSIVIDDASAALVILKPCGGFEHPMAMSLTVEEGLAVAIVDSL